LFLCSEKWNNIKMPNRWKRAGMRRTMTQELITEWTLEYVKGTRVGCRMHSRIMVSLSLILERKTEHPGTDGVGECGSSFYFHLLSEVQSKIVTAGMSYSKVLRVFLSERAIVAIQSDLLFAFVFFISLTSMSKCAFLLNYRQHLQVPSFSAAPRVILTSPVTFQLYVLELVTYISLFLFFFNL
jgi:hypothetical protein